jgi:hypothetical protein
MPVRDVARKPCLIFENPSISALSVSNGLHIPADEDLKFLHGDARFEALAAEAHKQALAQQAKTTAN